MAEYAVYGKHTLPYVNIKGEHVECDKIFMPLNEKGIRVTKRGLTNTFATKEDAQEWIDNHKFIKGAEISIRKIS